MSRPSMDVSTGVRKAAVLMVLLGEDTASGLLREFSEEQLRSVGSEITRMGPVDPEEMAQVLGEYHDLLLQGQKSLGGLDFARKVVGGAATGDRTELVLEYLQEVHNAEQGLATLALLPAKRRAQILEG